MSSGRTSVRRAWSRRRRSAPSRHPPRRGRPIRSWPPPTNIEIGKQVADANGNPDRNLFVFDGSNGPQGPNHARVSENEARATPVQLAANSAVDVQNQQMAPPEQEQRKPVSMTA